MCTITVCPQGISKSSDFLFEALTISGLTNTDGGGFTFKKHTTKKVYISKGYTSSQELIDAINRHKLKDDDELVVHQRIGNKGAKNTDMCHPFVLSHDQSEILQNNKYVKSPTMVHNGTFHSYSKLNSDFSDTFWFVKELMFQKDLINMLKTDTSFFKELLSIKLSTNRLCFLFPGEETKLIKLGDFKEDQGYFFSNESYKNAKIKNVGGVDYSTGGSEDDYDDYDDYYASRYGYNNRFLNMPKLPSTDKDDNLGIPVVKSREDDKQWKKSSLAKGDIVLTGGGGSVCITDPKTGVDYRLYMDMWIPDKYKTDTQFTSIKFNPTTFNYTDFSYTCIEGESDLEIDKGAIYKIIHYKAGEQLVAMQRSFEIAGKINNIVYVPINRLIVLFTITPKNAQMYRKYRGFYDLCREHQSSKNILRKVNGVLNPVNFYKKKNTTFKGTDYRVHEALLIYQNLLTKKLYPNEYMEKINNKSLVVLD